MQENELNYYEKIGNWDFSQIKSKTEKDKILKTKLKNEFIALEQEIEDIKDDLEFIDYFISTSKDTKSLAESYYQSVKQINNFF